MIHQTIALSREPFKTLTYNPVKPDTKQSYQTIAADLFGVARELRKAKTPSERRDVIGALLWHADSLRRLLVTDRDAALCSMAEVPSNG